MAEGNKQWYVLRVVSGKELKVKEAFEKACSIYGNLKENLEQVLVPTEKVYVTRAGKKVLKEKVLFSGYVYVKVSFAEGVEDMMVNTTNVVNFVREREGGKKPEPIPEAQIARMIGVAEADSAESEDNVPNDFIVGEIVKVTFGPFNGFSGEIEEVNRERRKLKVAVKVFGRRTPVELDNSQVERE